MVSERFAVNEIIIEELDKACLEQALTITEVAFLYHKDKKYIYDLCQSGVLVSRRACVGSITLISKRSCDERWDENGHIKSKR